MKSNEEMTEKVLQRIKEYESEKKKRKPVFAGIAITVGAACLIGLLVIAISSKNDKGGNIGFDSNSDKEMPVKTIAVNKDAGLSGDIVENNPEEKTENTNNDSQMALPIIRDGDDALNVVIKNMVSDYPYEGSNETKIPDNGEVIIAPAVQAAMDEYGDSLWYDVKYLLYKDGNVLTDMQSYETVQDKLGALLYQAYASTFTDLNGVGRMSTVYGIHATHSNLQELPEVFKANPEISGYGCLITFEEHPIISEPK